MTELTKKLPTIIWDSETYPNFHCQVWKDLKTGQIWIAEISSRKRETLIIREKHYEFLYNNVGFNSMAYDDPLIRFVISGERSNEEIKKFSDRLIMSDVKPRFHNRTVDMRFILHLDNKHRAASLKYIECNLCSPDVRDLPFPPGKILTSEEMDVVIEYCINDVNETQRLYENSIDAVIFRQKLMEEIGLPCINYSDVKIGSFINLKEYKRNSGKTSVPSKGTNRTRIPIKDIVPKNIKFETPYFQNFLKDILSTSLIVKDKGCNDEKTGKEFHRHLVYKGKEYAFKVGGLHSEDDECDYVNKDGYRLIDKDVASMYPNTCANYGYYPEHLGKPWLDGYREMIATRLNHKANIWNTSLSAEERKRHELYSDAYKLALNGAYGKTNSIYDWQYDPKVTYSVTFTGQLCMLMLVERLGIAGIQVISANTDGVLLYVHESQEEKLESICQQWMEDTLYELEDTFYTRYFANNVNNYLAIKTDGKVKLKGAFEVDKMIGKQPAYHKDSSMKIVAIAVREYLVKGIPIEHTIKNHENIYDFCICMRARGSEKKGKASFYFETSKERTDLGKVVRFYASKSGGAIFKKYQDETITKIHATDRTSHTLFMKYKEGPYNIDHQFYIRQAKKLIKRENKTISLF